MICGVRKGSSSRGSVGQLGLGYQPGALEISGSNPGDPMSHQTMRTPLFGPDQRDLS